MTMMRRGLPAFSRQALGPMRSVQPCRLPVYNVAAASTAPTALNVFLLVHLTSTLCAHSIYRDQPESVRQYEMSEGDGVATEGGMRCLTPIRKLPPEIFADKGHDHHGEQQLQLLQTALPFGLGVRVGVDVGVELVGGDGRERVDVVILLVGHRPGAEVDE